MPPSRPFRRRFSLPWRSRERIRDEVEEEIRFHLDMRVQELVRSGLPPAEAARQARREFGDLDEARGMLVGADREMERVRRGNERLGELRRDLRFAVRALRRSPAFAVAAVLTLALAIGANTAVFSLVDGVLLRSLPYPEPDRLVALWEDHGRRGGPARERFDPADFFALRERSRTLAGVGAALSGEITLRSPTGPRRVGDAIVSRGYLELFGARPALGRFFLPEEESFPEWSRVVVLSDGLWRRSFGADSSVVGRSILLGGEPHSVVGVAAGGFRPPGPDVELWRPMRADPQGLLRDFHLLHVFGRLHPGASPEEAQAELDALASAFAVDHPERGAGESFRVVPLREQLLGPVRQGMLVLAGAVGFVLLLACANLAGLLISRARTREREMAIRAAIGAGRGRIVRQLLTESLLLCAIGGALGVALAFAGLDLLLALLPPETPRLAEVEIDARALGFASVLTLFTSLAFGLLPAVHASRPDPARILGTGSAAASGGGVRRARSVLVVAEVAIALVLLVGAGLLTRSFVRLTSVEPGFETENVLAVELDTGTREYRAPGVTDAFFGEIFRRLSGHPDVVAAGAVTFLPLRGEHSSASFHVDGEPLVGGKEAPTAWYRHVRGDYFAAMGMRLVKGRGIAAAAAEAAVGEVVVNETFAHRFLNGADPTGRRIRPEWSRDEWFTVVGVVEDVRHEGLSERPVPEIYFPPGRMSMTLVVRTAADPPSVLPAVREAVWSLDPSVAVDRAYTMEELVGRSVAMPRFYVSLFAAFAAAALLLAVLGIYGVTAHAVVQRSREIGVRMALGASRGSVLRLVLRQTISLALIGAGVGLGGALVLSRSLAGLLYGTSPADPSTFGLVALILAAVALLASYLPARRATRIDPAVALRE